MQFLQLCASCVDGGVPPVVGAAGGAGALAAGAGAAAAAGAGGAGGAGGGASGGGAGGASGGGAGGAGSGGADGGAGAGSDGGPGDIHARNPVHEPITSHVNRDGSVTTYDPPSDDGTLSSTTRHKDGTVVTRYQTSEGNQITVRDRPDGARIVDQGSRSTHYTPDGNGGTTKVQYDDGHVTHISNTDANGKTTTQPVPRDTSPAPHGPRTPAHRPLSQFAPTGPGHGPVATTDAGAPPTPPSTPPNTTLQPDGSLVTANPDSTHYVHHPDGSWHLVGPRGVEASGHQEFPQFRPATTQVVQQHDGSIAVTHPNGARELWQGDRMIARFDTTGRQA